MGFLQNVDRDWVHGTSSTRYKNIENAHHPFSNGFGTERRLLMNDCFHVERLVTIFRPYDWDGRSFGFPECGENGRLKHSLDRIGNET
jgi:hypothetical protein